MSAPGVVLSVSGIVSDETAVQLIVQVVPNAAATDVGYTVGGPDQTAYFAVANITDAHTGLAVMPASIVWQNYGTDTWADATAYVWVATLSGLAWGTVLTLDLAYNDTDAGVGTDPASTTTHVRVTTVPFHIASAAVSAGTAPGTFDVAVTWQVLPSFDYISPTPTDMRIFYLYLLDTTTSAIAVQPVFFTPDGTGDGSSWSSALPLLAPPALNSYTFVDAPLAPEGDAFVVGAVWINADNSFQFGPGFTDLTVCLGEDARITLADGTTRAIRDVVVGDVVATAGGAATRVTAVRRVEGGMSHRALWCIPEGVACATAPLWLTDNHAFWHSEDAFLAGEPACTAATCDALRASLLHGSSSSSSSCMGTTPPRRASIMALYNLQLENRGVMFANGVVVVGMA